MTAKPAPKKRRLGRAAAVGLTRERVVEAAISLIDEEGLPAFSVRALARRLNVFQQLSTGTPGAERPIFLPRYLGHLLRD